MPIGLIGAGLIGTAANVGSNIITNAGARNRQDDANDFNVQQWKRQNKYNDPSAQMARLRKAGLNPNMIYGTSPTSAVGNAQSVAPAKAAPFKINNPDPIGEINKYANLKQTEATTNNLAEINNLNIKKGLLTDAQTYKTVGEGASSNTKAKVDSALEQTSVQVGQEQLRQEVLRSGGMGLDNKYKEGSLQPRITEIAERIKLIKAQTNNVGKQASLNKLKLELRALGIETNDSKITRIVGKNWDKITKHVEGTLKYFKNTKF